MDERNQSRGAASVWKPGHRADFDGIRETGQSRDPTGWHGRCRKRNPQSAHRFDAQQSLHQRWATNSYRSLPQPIEPGLTASFNRSQQLIQTEPLLRSNIANQQTPQPCFHP